MHILLFILIGLIAGVAARLVTPGRKGPFGFLVTGLLGVIGAFAVVYLGQEAGWYQAEERVGLFAAALGAVLSLSLWAVLFRSGRSSSSL